MESGDESFMQETCYLLLNRGSKQNADIFVNGRQYSMYFLTMEDDGIRLHWVLHCKESKELAQQDCI